MKIKETLIRHNMLFRLIITIMLIICVPMLIIGWLIVGETRSKLEQQNNEIFINNAANFMEYFNSQRNEMVNTAVKIGYEQKITAEYMEQHPYHVLEMIELLSYYKRNVPIANKMFIYFRNKVYIVGSEVKYDKNIFIKAYSGSEETAGRIESILNQAGGNKVEYISNLGSTSNDCVFSGMLVCVSASVSTKNDAVILYYLDHQSLDTSFLGAMNSDQYELYIVDGSGKLLLSNKTSTDELPDDARFKEFIGNKDVRSISLSARENNYSIFKQYDPISGLSFVITMPESYSTQSVQSYYRLLQVTISVTIAAFVIMLASVVYINYRPVMTLIRKIRGTGDEYAAAGEIKLIDLILERKSHENETLTEKLTENKLKLTDYLLWNLLEGKAITSKDMDGIGLVLPGPYFCVILASGISLGNTDYANIAAAVQKLCGSHVGVTHSFYDNHFVFICTLQNDGKTAREQLTDTIDRVLRQTQNGKEYKLSVGSCETGLDTVQDSYLSALIAFEQEHKKRTVFYEEAINNFSDFQNYPSEEALRFIQCIRQGDAGYAMAEFEKVIDYISQHAASHISEQYLCYDIIIMFIKDAMKLGIPLSDQDMGGLFMYSHIQCLRHKMTDLIGKVCTEVTRRKTASGKQLVQSVKAFINENYDDSNLNLSMVADHFNTSIYVISTTFNEFAGMSFRKYIVNRRIEESKRLLLGTEKSIKDITCDVGFCDVSYFIKVFKKACAVTPNKFRETLTKPKAGDEAVAPMTMAARKIKH